MKPKPEYAAANVAFDAIRRRGAAFDRAVEKAALRFDVDPEEVARIVRRAFDLGSESGLEEGDRDGIRE